MSSNDTFLHGVYEHEVNSVGNALENIGTTWALEVKIMLNELVFSYLWNNDTLFMLRINDITERLHDQFLQKWFIVCQNCQLIVLLNSSLPWKIFLSCLK